MEIGCWAVIGWGNIKKNIQSKRALFLDGQCSEKSRYERRKSIFLKINERKFLYANN